MQHNNLLDKTNKKRYWKKSVREKVALTREKYIVLLVRSPLREIRKIATYI